MKAPTSALRFENATALLNYGFTNYSYKQFGNSGDVVKTINVSKGIEPSVNAIFEQDCGALLKKGTENQISQSINIVDNISAPVFKGDILGNITYSVDDKIIETVNIVAEKDIAKISLIKMTKYVYTNWFNLNR